MSQRFPEAARRVSRLQIERFYRTCGEGTFDDTIIDDLGIALYARCQSMLGNMTCPECGEPLTRRERSLACPECDWTCAWDDFRRTPAGKHLSPGRMEPFVSGFVRAYSATKTTGEKIVLIDTLIHRFHGEMESGNKPGAYNLIEGEMTDVAAFLDRLTYGDNMPADATERKARWRRRLESAPRFWSEQLSDERE